MDSIGDFVGILCIYTSLNGTSLIGTSCLNGTSLNGTSLNGRHESFFGYLETLLFLKNNHNRIFRISMPNNTFIGYSSNDFFYEKPDYCGDKTNGKYIINKTTNETADINEITPENENKNDTTNNIKTLCITNEKYGKLLKESNSETATADSRYEYTLKMYNRELLRTVNYVAGIAFLGAYIYVNQKMK